MVKWKRTIKKNVKKGNDQCVSSRMFRPSGSIVPDGLNIREETYWSFPVFVVIHLYAIPVLFRKLDKLPDSVYRLFRRNSWHISCFSLAFKPITKARIRQRMLFNAWKFSENHSTVKGYHTPFLGQGLRSSFLIRWASWPYKLFCWFLLFHCDSQTI